MTTTPSLARRILGYAGMLLALALVVVPLAWILVASLKTQGDIYTLPAR